MYEEEIAREVIEALCHLGVRRTLDFAPKVNLRISELTDVDLVLLSRKFSEKIHGTILAGTKLCVNRCKAEIFCLDCGRHYRGPFIFDVCSRCGGEHFEHDDHVQVAVDLVDRRAWHKTYRQSWRLSLPAV